MTAEPIGRGTTAGPIGRDRERAALVDAATAAWAGHGALVLVSGEAGVGKTTLVRSALAGSGLLLIEGPQARVEPSLIRGWIAPEAKDPA